MYIDPQKEIARVNQGEFVECLYLGTIGAHNVVSRMHVLRAYGLPHYGRYSQGATLLIHVDDAAGYPELFSPIAGETIPESETWEEVTTTTIPDMVLTESSPEVTGDEADEQGNGAEVVSPSSAPPDFSKLSYKDIQQELKAIGKSAAGKQDVLLARLNKAYGIS